MHAIILAALVCATPTRTTVGIWVNQVGAIDLKANTFSVDFWIWFRSTGLDGSPIDSFELIDGRVESKTNVIKKKLPSGEDYAAARISARVHQEWNLRRYPLDDHTLQIAIEDADRDVGTSVLVADQENAGVDPSVTVAGWTVGDMKAMVAPHAYASNFGDTSISKTAATEYSRYTASLEVSRGGTVRFFKVIFALLVSVLVSYSAFHLHPSVGARISVPIGALFAGAAGSIAINSQLPDLQYMTITDKAVFLSLGMISVALAASVLTLNLYNQKREALQKRIDGAGKVLFPVLYALGLALILA